MKNFSQFFITRPIFATVISIIIIILGAIGYSRLSVSQYPDIVPPTIVVETAYPGASPEVLVENVVTPLEQEINGVDNMMYISSKCNFDNTISIEITFELGTDVDTAQVLVQNRVEAAKPRLPEEVRNVGVRVRKRSPSMLLGMALFSPDSSRDNLYVTNYLLTQIKDKILRVKGVGDIYIFGAREYSMRIWLNPDKLANLNLSSRAVLAAIKEQNKQVAAGRLNQSPMEGSKSPYELLVSAKGRLKTPDEFGEIIVKRSSDGEIVRLKDIAKIELGAYSYADKSYYNGMDAVGFIVYQQPGSNAVETAAEVKKLFEELKKDFPTGLDYKIGVDNTTYISESVSAVYRTIFEALVLVVIVMMVFLQDWRATIIPIFAIPVSLVGTFFFMSLFGFSINNLSLFGLVLAIGIVVDDAIVVIENVDRNMREGLSAMEATKKAMSQVQTAIVAIVLVLTSVFIPTAFIKGISGEFYRQFALTIAASTIISGLVSLTLTPALSALMLKREENPDKFSRIWNFCFGRFFSLFNKSFSLFSEKYCGLVKKCVGYWPAFLAAFAGLIGVAAWLFMETPKGFIPSQDTCYFFVTAQLPDGATLDRTDAVMKKAEAVVRKTLPELDCYMTVSGINAATFGRSPNAGAMFIRLKSQRERGKLGIPLNDSIARLTNAFYREIPEALLFIIKPPTVEGIGFGSDFKGFIQDKSGRGLAAIETATKQVVGKARGAEPIASALTMFRIGNPQIFADIDRERAERLNVNIGSVFDTLQFNIGSVYVNDFNILDRSYKVVVQAEGAKRETPEDILNLKVQNDFGENVPLGSFTTLSRTTGPEVVNRFNLYPCGDIMGNLKAGYSTGQAIESIESICRQTLPSGMDIEWTDLAFQEKRAGNSSMYIFALCTTFVFLLLAAMYESWRLPLSVILIVPLVLLFSIAGLVITGSDNNLMAQIGFIVLIGLACKNAILIVEFAKQRQERGEDVLTAVSLAAKNRLRPILMTSFAFILGVLPLVYASGAGAELRRPLGASVFFGMLGVTIFGLVFTPVFFYIIRRRYVCSEENQ